MLTIMTPFPKPYKKGEIYHYTPAIEKKTRNDTLITKFREE